MTAANSYGNQPVVELLDALHHLKRLLTPAKVNQESPRSMQAQKQLNRLRLICETINAQLQEQLHLSKQYVKSIWGLMTRIATKVTAHSVGMMVNLALGRPPLHLASLAA